MKLTGERRIKFLRWHNAQPEVRIMKGGSPNAIKALLSELERKAGKQQKQKIPGNEYLCNFCGRKYEAPMELMNCPRCEENEPDSGDYDFGADEDDLVEN